MLTALIMAGGQGTRFWPLSTEENPKQFLKLIGNETMIQMTVNRITPIIPIERIFVCTGKRYVELLREQLPNLPERNIIIEPEGRNTTPCIALSALVINRYYKNANMLVLPSDHLIKNEEKFREIIEDANEFVKDNNKAIITLGMIPTRAETGYGYIKSGEEYEKINNNTIIKVNRFVEKPNVEKAQKYLKEGNYLWNGGMFLWNIDNILKQIKKYSPNTYEALHRIIDINDKYLQREIDNNYCRTEEISIDYSVLEKAKDIYVVQSNIGWDDIGSWEAIERYRECDSFGNVYMGKVNGVKSENNLIVSTNNNVIIDGISNIYVIENNGEIIIGKKSELFKIKQYKDIYRWK